LKDFIHTLLSKLFPYKGPTEYVSGDYGWSLQKDKEFRDAHAGNTPNVIAVSKPFGSK
jgi:hypothetical protein